MTTDMSDARLRQAVLDELAWDARVDAQHLDVEVTEGVVTLVGTVPSYALKLGAELAAVEVDGVHDLVNDIDVKPNLEGWPGDDELTTMVEQVLTWDALVPEQHLTISVADGQVTLEGRVEVAVQREEAERAVARLDGVRGVNNRIDVQGPTLAPEEVRRTISAALARRATHRADHIDVTVSGSTVTLRGPVQSRREKQSILGAVRHAQGISRVIDKVWVDPVS